MGVGWGSEEQLIALLNEQVAEINPSSEYPWLTVPSKTLLMKKLSTQVI